MTIKRKLCKHKTGKREYYHDDTVAYHSFQEIKDFCYYEAMKHMSLYDVITYTFVVIDTDEEIDIVCSWFEDSDDFYDIKLEVAF